MMLGQAAFVAAGGAEDSSVSPALFLIVLALGLALVFLYRSMRRQLRRIDFDAEGSSDAERMRRDGSSNGGTAP
ncbi:MAG TPA: hypothetical protein VHI11_13985 [Jiangellaceae bacterium]|jgi:hypothetical protein|nr:hypothetical protein [Jiangellaceae bacterium]